MVQKKRSVVLTITISLSVESGKI